MKGEEELKIQETTPRLEEISDGVSFAEIVAEKEKNKRPGRVLDPLLAKVKSDYAHLILSGIFLIIATIFLLLSWRFNTLKERVFTPGSLSFITSCVCYGVALGFALWGGIGLIMHKAKIAEIHAEENAKQE